MACRCIDIANCKEDIATLEDAQLLIRRAENRYDDISSTENNILKSSRLAYELDDYIREEMNQLIRQSIKDIELDLDSTVQICRKKIRSLEATLRALEIEDEEYHRSEE